MLHEKNINPVNIEKLLDEARNRKPVMQLDEVEQLLQNQPAKKNPNYWKNIPLLLVFFMLATFFGLYYFNRNTHESAINFSTEKSLNVEGNSPVSTEENVQNQLKRNENYSIDDRGNATNKNTQIRSAKKTIATRRDVPATGSKSKDPQTLSNTSSGWQAPIHTKPAFTLNGWALVSKMPAQFVYGLDNEVVFNGEASAYINSGKSNYNSAWLTQEINAAKYAGKRLRMTAMVKSENAGKKAWAGIFMNIKGENFKKAGFDNLYDKNITGQSDWVKCELVMDIPAESKKISFGLYKVYGGNAWIDNISLEVVNPDVPQHYKTQTEAQDTNLVQPDLGSRLAEIVVEKPLNLDFEKLKNNDLPSGWHIGEEKQHFRAMYDDKVFHSGKSSAFLQSTGYIEKDWNTLLQYCKPGEYAGKRIKFTAWVRTENLKHYAQVLLMADGVIKNPRSEKIQAQTFTGNNDWRKVELVLDIPEEAAVFSYGILLEGKGKVWIDDITIEILSSDNNTGKNKASLQPINLDFEE